RRAELAGRVDGCLAILLPDRENRDAHDFPKNRDAHDFQPRNLRPIEDDPRKGNRVRPHFLYEQLEWIAALMPGRAWLGVELLGAAQAFSVPCVACGDVHMHARSRRALQDTLTAIRLKCTLAEAGYRLFPNGERHLRARERLARIYPPELLAETLAVAARC